MKGFNLNTNELELFRWGARYFVENQDDNGFYLYYEELTPFEIQSLVGFYIENYPGQNPLRRASKIREEDLTTVSLLDGFPGVALTEMQRLLKFYNHYAQGLTPNSQLEAGTHLVYFKDKNVLKFVVPDQVVSVGRWDWKINDTKKMVFLDPDYNIPGVDITLPVIRGMGGILVGDSHSHNTINCTWSEADFTYQAGSKEKPLPPQLHLLIYAMKLNKVKDAEPDFKFLASVNVFGDLVNANDEDIVFVDDVIPWEEVKWVGAAAVEKVAKPYVAPVTAKVWNKNNHNQLPPATPGKYYGNSLNQEYDHADYWGWDGWDNYGVTSKPKTYKQAVKETADAIDQLSFHHEFDGNYNTLISDLAIESIVLSDWILDWFGEDSAPTVNVEELY